MMYMNIGENIGQGNYQENSEVARNDPVSSKTMVFPPFSR